MVHPGRAEQFVPVAETVPVESASTGTVASVSYHHTAAFRGARFTASDLAGATFRDCNLSGIRIASSWVIDVSVSGEVQNLVVNDVDVTAFVAAELDRRHPERVQQRAMRSAADHRAMWDVLERLWAETVARAGRLPEPALHDRVDGEWSFVETLRHLVFATDSWAGRTVLGEPMPYHRLGLVPTDFDPVDTAAVGIDLAATPSFDEVLAVRADRMAQVRRIVDGLTDSELDRMCAGSPWPADPAEPRPVRDCLRVLVHEECEHRRFAVRDLTMLEARS